MQKIYLPPRARNAHKGNFGHALVIGGDYGMAGAIRLAGEACARVGAGLVSIATHPKHISIVTSARPELLCFGIDKIRDIDKPLGTATVIAIGPGLGQSKWSKQLFKKALTTDLPKVLDADALNLLAKKPSYRNDWILTPHPGEAARLLKTTIDNIQSDRFTAAYKLQKNYGGTIVLKGANTIIFDASGKTNVCTAGNPGMASGGMGDVLTGVIVGLLAQGANMQQAAEIGVHIHAMAGDIAAQEGERGLLALDLMPHLRTLVNQY